MSRPCKPFLFFPPPSRRVPNVDTAHALVCVQFPGAIRHGSLGSWHWKRREDDQFTGEVIAECIAAVSGPDWFLRLAAPVERAAAGEGGE